MTRAQLRRRGFRVNVEKMEFGGHEYAVYDAETDTLITSGWVLGNKGDTVREAEADLRGRGLLLAAHVEGESP